MAPLREFSNPNTPAPAGSILYELLRQEEDRRFIYRGQTRAYPGPLLPSAYRPFFSADDTPIDTTHPLAKYSIRQCGQKFYGDHNFKIAQSVENLFAALPQDEAKEARLVFDKAMNGAVVAILQLNSRARGDFYSWFEILERVLEPCEKQIFARYASKWKACLDRYHRRVIRSFFFHLVFGYFMGTALAQQYGLHSACLDMTASVDVGMFFATHGPADDYLAPLQDGVGIIYRLPYEFSRLQPLGTTEYYQLPPLIDVVRVLEDFAEPQPAENMMDDFQVHCRDVYQETNNGRSKWTFPQQSVKNTRVSRQAAVILVPDELRRDLPGKHPAVGGIIPSAFEYVEDLGARVGMETFYFRHTGTCPHDRRFTREYLWPREDPLLPPLISGLTAVYPPRRFAPHFIPYRLDLIDAGFQKDAFRMICEGFARKYPLVLWSEDGLRAVAMGKLVV